jgi:hypothetical protein
LFSFAISGVSQPPFTLQTEHRNPESLSRPARLHP